MKMVEVGKITLKEASERVGVSYRQAKRIDSAIGEKGMKGLVHGNWGRCMSSDLLLNNQKIRTVIDAITSEVVLILGRFKEERKSVLDAIKDELRKRNYTSILFDFDKPSSRN